MATKKKKLTRDQAWDLYSSKLDEAGIDPEHEQDLFETFFELTQEGFDHDTLVSFIEADIEAIRDNS